jgi:hypothetical protein
MKAWQRVATLGGLLLTTGCGEPRLVGLSCGPDGCAVQVGPPYETCVTHELATSAQPVPAGGHSDHCQLFTLDSVTSPTDDSRAFLSVAVIDGTPRRDDIDLRMAAAIPDWPDGVVDCAKLLAEPIAWIPLATTVGEAGETNLEAAPIVARRTYRLLVRDTFINMLARDVQPRVKVTLKCASQPQPTVTEPVELAHRLESLAAGSSFGVRVTCAFAHPTLVNRLFRRTGRSVSLDTRFNVRALDADAGLEPLWVSVSDSDWTHQLESPAYFATGERIAWECTLFNSGVTAISDPRVLADTCSLFGMFRDGDGYRVPSPEACVAETL